MAGSNAGEILYHIQERKATRKSIFFIFISHTYFPQSMIYFKHTKGRELKMSKFYLFGCDGSVAVIFASSRLDAEGKALQECASRRILGGRVDSMECPSFYVWL